jgi:putative chitinase
LGVVSANLKTGGDEPVINHPHTDFRLLSEEENPQMVTDDELRQIMPTLSASTSAQYTPFLQQAMNEFAINTYLREAAFLAQLAHESMELKAWQENLNYSAQGLLKTFPKYFKTADLANAYARNPQKIANRVYANRMGNGDEASGDGWRYRGRGPIQLTGKNNYQAFGGTLNLDLVGNPDSVATPEVGFRVAAAYWASNKLNPLADQQKFQQISAIINGRDPAIGLDDRLKYYARAKQALSRNDAPAPPQPPPQPAAPTPSSEPSTVDAASAAVSAFEGAVTAAAGGTRSIGTGGSAGRGGEASGTRSLPSNLSRGIYPGIEQEFAQGGGEPSSGKKGSAKKGAGKKTAGKKTAAKKASTKKASGKSAKKASSKKASAEKGGSKKSSSKKSSGKKGGAKKGGGSKKGGGGGSRKGASKKGGSKKGASKKGGAGKRR